MKLCISPAFLAAFVFPWALWCIIFLITIIFASNQLHDNKIRRKADKTKAKGKQRTMGKSTGNGDTASGINVGIDGDNYNNDEFDNTEEDVLGMFNQQLNQNVNRRKGDRNNNSNSNSKKNIDSSIELNNTVKGKGYDTY